MSKLSLESIRSSLKKNKIFFETIAALLVSTMAVLVSYSQLHIARVQINISKQVALPHFVIRAKQLTGSTDSQTYDEDEITVENQGSVITNFRGNSVVLLDVKLSGRNSPTEKTFYLTGYYLGHAYSPQGQGLLITIKGYKNNQKYSNLDREFFKLVESKNEFGNTELRRFLHITYTDQLGDNHSEYYYVPLIYGASQITEKEGKAIFSGCENSLRTGKHIEFDKLSAESLYDLVAGK
jgi:hypothetical protein